MTCQIIKELYKLKQLVKLWYKKLISLLISEKFQIMNADLSILIKKNKNTVIIINVYVDDFLIVSKNMQRINWMKIILNKVFQMLNLKEMQVIVDLQIIKDRNKKKIILNQTSYI